MPSNSPAELPVDCMVANPACAPSFQFDKYHDAVQNSCGIVVKPTREEPTGPALRQLFYLRHCNHCPHQAAAENIAREQAKQRK